MWKSLSTQADFSPRISHVSVAPEVPVAMAVEVWLGMIVNVCPIYPGVCVVLGTMAGWKVVGRGSSPRRARRTIVMHEIRTLVSKRG
ncbi:Hypp8617 [Branchiostoma lanceolatum]|uniref:Hypp8617 protein n=1 Tax=Branchiostoma lanceolatum TaxID=7740 RepID=A0A8J9Z7X5_BRALA|nr:Hypp8617 [Branchiostoma lanceolatum]